MSKPLIEAKLLSLDNFLHLLKKVEQYRDKKLLVSLSDKFQLELSKPDIERAGDHQYLITGFDHTGKRSEETPIGYLSRLFDSRNVDVQVYDKTNAKLRPIKQPLSIDALMFRLARNSYNNQGTQQKVEGTLIDIASLWRVPQLLGLAEWINSYQDESINISLEAQHSNVYMKLKKPKISPTQYAEDQPYDVVATSTGKIFESLMKIFSEGPVHFQANNTYKDESWCILKNPMPLEHFVMELMRQHDETKYRERSYSTAHLRMVS